MITQILLAAGLSTRMKTPKPLLDFEGVPLLGRLLEECRQSTVDTIVVVLGHEKEKILQQVDFSGISVVVNSHYTKGQTSSFQCALQNLDPETEAFLNLPVDHPLVTRKEIDTVVEAYRNREPGAKIFIPMFEGREGRPVLFDISVAKEILALTSEQPVNEVIERLQEDVSFVPIANPYTMKDMDTPEDYRECLEIFSRTA